MGDSEDEYDRRRGRDKFRRERNDYNDRNSGNRRDDWQESRESGGTGVSWNNQNRDRIPQRRDYRDNYSMGGGGGGGGVGGGPGGGGQRRERYSPADRSDMSPPMKRMRGGRDWEDRSGNYPNYEVGGYGAGAHHNTNNWSQLENNGPNPQNQNQHRENEGPTQPPMMTFKQFLGTQDDGIDDQIAVKKYNDYKLDFKKRQILEFFTAHKDEEWFRSKYHPEEYDKRKLEQTAALKNRLNVFLDLLANNWIDSVSVDVEKANQIIRLLNAAVIKLEGGSDFDLKSLDENYEEEKAVESDLALFSVDVEKPQIPADRRNSEVKSDRGAGDESDNDLINKEVEKSESDDKEVKKDVIKEELEEEEKEVEENNKPEIANMDSNASMEEGEASMDASESKATLDDDQQESVDQKVVKQEEKVESPVKANANNNEVEKPRPLHKTVSIFMRNLAPTITKQEIEESCRRYPGFLRLCIADPTSDRRFYRRGWATYERTVNIKEICWSFNSSKLRDCDLGVIINRDLSRRIRSVNGIASHKNVVRADIRHAAKIVLNLDKQSMLWDDESANSKEANESQPMFGFASKNPLLKNITDYLIEEASAEEEELLGTSEIGELDDGDENEKNGPSLDRDESLIKVLDRLLLYLRIVHSIDYYNHSDYPNEDEMPNRIGLMHARGMVSTSSRVTQQEINDYIKHFESKIQSYLVPPPVVTEDEAKKLGLKDPEEEAEVFIKANTQELAKDKWLCPLSGKKFKGPDFVRKHILNKHIERVDEAKQNAVYINNYIFDPKRPQLPEHISNRPQNSTPNRSEGANPMAGVIAPGYMPGPGGPYPGPPMAAYMAGGYGPRGPPMGAFGGPMMGYGRGYPPMGMGPMHEYGRGPMGHQKPRFTRKRINYRDLDAPNDDHDLNN